MLIINLRFLLFIETEIKELRTNLLYPFYYVAYVFAKRFTIVLLLYYNFGVYARTLENRNAYVHCSVLLKLLLL